MKHKLLELWRIEKGLKKSEVANAVKLSQPTIDKAERGLFTLKTWNRLVTFYGKKERVTFDEND